MGVECSPLNGYVMAPDNFILPFAAFYDTPILRGLKDLRVYYPLQNVTMSLDASRAQTHMESLGQDESPASRSFSAHRSMSFAWKLTENGFLNLSGDYSVDVTSTLVHLETDANDNQRPFSSIIRDLILKDQLISFGYDNGYSQSIKYQYKTESPRVLFPDLNKYFTLNTHYNVSYRWQNNLQQGDLGKGVKWGNSINAATDISLKQFVETWFPSKKGGEAAPEQTNSHRVGRGRGHEDDPDLQDVQEHGPQTPQVTAPIVRDTTQAHDSTKVNASTQKVKKAFSLKEGLLEFARYAIRAHFSITTRSMLTSRNPTMRRTAACREGRGSPTCSDEFRFSKTAIQVTVRRGRINLVLSRTRR